MTLPFDSQWADEVSAYCDPIFDAAGVGFVRQVLHDDESGKVVSALLWEADPGLFAGRYPDSGVVESYGEDQWAGVRCIDYWVYVDHDRRRCRLNVEGWNLPELIIELNGHGDFDGSSIADTFARILGVLSPRD